MTERDWRTRRFDHHPPCPGGCNQLADECACARPNPLGSLRVTQPRESIGLMEFPRSDEKKDSDG